MAPPSNPAAPLHTLVDHVTLEQTAAPGNDDPNTTITVETNLQGNP